jgi:adenylate cyclase
MTADIDGLLNGLTGQARRERAELIHWLVEHGFTTAQIRQTLVPMLLPANRKVGDDGTYVSTHQISQASGIDIELLQQLQRAAGLTRVEDADATVQLRVDAESVLGTKVFFDFGFDVDEVVGILRVLVDGLGHAAEAMRKAALKRVLRPGASELELALAFEQMAEHLTPRLTPLIADLLHLQLRRSFETEAINVTERHTGSLPGARQITVAFADLVGFTELGEMVAPEDLEHVASRLSELARDVVTTPVRFVKTIGDAVMFVSTDPVSLLDVVVKLASAAAAQDLPRLRVGIASGWAVSHAGDWYGSPVNIASRITSVARPGTVVAAESVRNEVGDECGFHWSSQGARSLRGVTQRVNLYTVDR